MRVETVESEADFREFVLLPLRLHPRDMAVPLLESTVRSWWEGTSPHPEPIELVVVRDEQGLVVARSTVHTDSRLDERLGVRSLLFGATEFANAAAAEALFAGIVSRSGGQEQLVGPVSLLPNQAGGVITSGFDQPGFVDSAWNPAAYPAFYEAAGFSRLWESDTWRVPVSEVSPVAQESWDAAGVRLEYGEADQVKKLIPEIRALLNESFAALPYYTQITDQEMAVATDGLDHLLDSQLLLLARDNETDQALAFVLVVPDITKYVQRVGGRLGFAQQVMLFLTKRRYRRAAILIVQGTSPSHRGQGLLSLLSRQLQANLHEGGYQELRSTYVGRDNPGSSRQFERFGGSPLHGYTFYRRGING